MTVDSPQPAPPAPAPSFAQRLQRFNTVKSRRVAAIVTPIALLALALAVRLVNLDQFPILVFDETYYVKDAYTLYLHGYETRWGDEPNPAFEAGDDSAMSDEPSFVVHPPLGKWILGIGMALFGFESPWAWRLPAVLVGAALVLVTYFIAKGITRSTFWGGVAGYLLAIDSQAIVMSRTVLLDTVLALFVALGIGALFLDRRHAPARVVRWMQEHGRWRPAFLLRPWLIVAGVAFGAAAATKWSGLYFLAAFGLWSVLMDVLDQWKATKRGISWLGFLTQGPASFLLVVVPAAATYVVSYAGWFLRGGYYRNWAEEDAANRISWLPDWLPLDVHSFVHYQISTYEFHVELTKDHAFQSPAIEWLLMLRPTGFASESHDDGAVVQYVSAMPNPFIWWAGTVAIFVGLFMFGRTMNTALGATLLAIAAGYVPWLLYPDRTIFSFYTIVYTPFLIILIVILLRWLVCGLPGSPASPDRRLAGSIFVGGYLLLVTIAYAFWSPVTYGYPIDQQWMRLRYWLPGWR
ncbi:phospholipid carrier-dependent glycosyltransferase [uncultured Agrococcus sp.]|uniref:dolichyl-phosphate-mannose--protein mannosyltransferase n=1 Tax=uncultured Agrococcus sp. TaxID=382258 RepID=UPI0025EA7B48|nr:phospholipid carrier-dependent glycosyltransferase [uncultured Agrococcus sp.]